MEGDGSGEMGRSVKEKKEMKIFRLWWHKLYRIALPIC